MILVDTSVWIDHVKGATNWQTTLLHAALRRLRFVMLGDIVWLELLQGVSSPQEAERLRLVTETLPRAALMSFPIAEAASRHYRVLRQAGRTPRKVADLIIGTWCIENSIPLLHRDRDFLPMQDYCGLQTATFPEN